MNQCFTFGQKLLFHCYLLHVFFQVCSAVAASHHEQPQSKSSYIQVTFKLHSARLLIGSG